MLSLDTETTGIDFHYGAQPFLVTFCDNAGFNTWFEWDVDPLTRKPIVPLKDIKQIRRLCSKAKSLVLQNSKFDVKALKVGVGLEDWDWGKVDDTLIAGHLINSGEPHDLTFMVMRYLHSNLTKYEDEIKKATKEARNYVRRQYPDWLIAKAGLPCMPSAKGEVWKFDMWLPRAIAKEEKYKEDHPWWTVLSTYANVDSVSTYNLFKVQRKILKERGLWDIYKHRLKLLPIAYDMQDVGVTLNSDWLEGLQTTYKQEYDANGATCQAIAEEYYEYDLDLPKSGNNTSLHTFLFHKEGLNLPVLKRSKKTDKPTFDKNTMDLYLQTLPEGNALEFISALKARKKRGTEIQYMDGYKRFWLPLLHHAFVKHKDEQPTNASHWRVLYPSVNPTGTRTLRWSSSNPNQQNISKQKVNGKSLRSCFGPAPGREWWALDYDNLELRIPGYECQEPAMLELFENPNEPPFYGSYHLLIFSILYPKEWKKL